VLFSDEATARIMGELYECAWECVRPVPRVEIDFGDGRKLMRTLQGNVATHLCTADGRVFDIIPGLATPEGYRKRLHDGAALANVFKALWGRPERLVADYHRELERGVTRERVDEIKSYVDFSKSGIEGSIKKALAGALEATMAADQTKRRAERPVADALRADVEYNVKVRMPMIHKLLAEKPLAAPADLTAGLFRDILGYDIEDPWLGLAPAVLGGEGGRHE